MMVVNQVRKASLLSNVTEEKENIIRSKSSDEGIGLNSTFESLPYIDDDDDPNSDDEHNNDNTESKMLIPVAPAAASAAVGIRINTCLQTNLTGKNNVETEEEREIMIDISGAPAKQITSTNANIKTWQKFTKQIIVAKNRFKNQDEKKQMKKVWKENYACMVSQDKFVDRISEVSAKPADIAKVKPPYAGLIDKEKEMKKNVIDDIFGKTFYDRSSYALADAQIEDQSTAGTVTLKAINSYYRFNIRTRSVDVFLEGGPTNLPSQILERKKRRSLHLERALQQIYNYIFRIYPAGITFLI